MGGVLGSSTGQKVGLYQNDVPTFPPDAGFTFERKPRQMIAKTEDLISARVEPKHRGYCSHLLIDYDVCRYKNFPWVYKCAHEKHNFLNCEHDDYVIRMKEFERERRLRLREQRLSCEQSA